MQSGDPTPLTIVLGMHRSGTSLCSNIVSVLGYNMVRKLTGSFDNVNGHWERGELVDFHDRMLALFGRDWGNPAHVLPLPSGWWARPSVREIRDEMIEWLRPQVGRGRRFGFKDPRAALLLPVWREICTELELAPRYVFCVRPPEMVARSLSARGDVPQLEDGVHRWLVYNARALAEIGDADICVVPFADWFERCEQNLAHLTRFLDTEGMGHSPLARDAVAAVIDPGLRHHADLSGSTRVAIIDELYRQILDCVGQTRLPTALRELATFCCRYEQLVQGPRELALQSRAAQVQIAELQRQLAAERDEVATMRQEMALLRERLEAAPSAMTVQATEAECVTEVV